MSSSEEYTPSASDSDYDLDTDSESEEPAMTIAAIKEEIKEIKTLIKEVVKEVTLIEMRQKLARK